MAPATALAPEGGRPGGVVGCAVCAQTGYQGRTGVFELLVTDEVITNRRGCGWGVSGGKQSLTKHDIDFWHNKEMSG